MSALSRRIQHRDEDDRLRKLSDNVTAVAVLSDTTLIVAGPCTFPAVFGEHLLLGDSGSSGFVGRVDTKGRWLWIHGIAV